MNGTGALFLCNNHLKPLKALGLKVNIGALHRDMHRGATSMRYSLKTVLALVLGVSCLSQATAQSVFDQVGLTDLRNRLGASAPTGAGVIVMQGEALVGPNQYLPDSSLSDFAGKTFTDRSGGGAVSGHASA
jgi:hypothetical protein